MRSRQTARRRHGMTVVETALVMTVFAMLLFGIFEYCRFLMVLHVTNNAARDAVRYASVNLDKPSDFNSADYTDATNYTYPSVEGFTKMRMGGMERQIQDFKVRVYPADPAGLAQTPPVIRPKSTSTATPKQYPDPFKTNDPNASFATPWNQASFTDRLAVTIRGAYRPALPTFLMMPSSIPIDITALAGGEG